MNSESDFHLWLDWLLPSYDPPRTFNIHDGDVAAQDI